LFDITDIKVLTRKHIKIHIIGLFHEVSDDITCLYQLYKSIASLIALSKMLTPWITERDHIDLFDKLFGEADDMQLTADGLGPAHARIQNKMLAPALHTYTTVYSSPKRHHPMLRQRDRELAEAKAGQNVSWF